MLNNRVLKFNINELLCIYYKTYKKINLLIEYEGDFILQIFFNILCLPLIV